MIRLRAVALALVCLVVVLGAGASTAGASAVLPTGFSVQNVVTGLNGPVGMAFAPDGRVFIIEKNGYLKVRLPNGTLKTVLDMHTQVDYDVDRGLLGIALDKDFQTNDTMYLLYTVEASPLNPTKGDATVSKLVKLQVDANNNVVNPGNPFTTILGTSSETVCAQPYSNTDDCIPADYDEHAIGTVRVDPSDGTLWLGSGDSTPEGFDEHALQTLNENTYVGKIIHIDTNGKGLAGHPFCPSDNNLSDVCTKLYAKGFRNPFRFVLRDGGKGPSVGDVGWASKEELDLTRPGKNYGWPCFEGSSQPIYWQTDTCKAEYTKYQNGDPTAEVLPTTEYDHVKVTDDEGHDQWIGCITGGPVYTGTNCTCDANGCTCETLSFARCESW
jgi:glucose/arabinose dehydrogenase